jgi:hypothetical protein
MWKNISLKSSNEYYNLKPKYLLIDLIIIIKFIQNEKTCLRIIRFGCRRCFLSHQRELRDFELEKTQISRGLGFGLQEGT